MADIERVMRLLRMVDQPGERLDPGLGCKNLMRVACQAALDEAMPTVTTEELLGLLAGEDGRQLARGLSAYTCGSREMRKRIFKILRAKNFGRRRGELLLGRAFTLSLSKKKVAEVYVRRLAKLCESRNYARRLIAVEALSSVRPPEDASHGWRKLYLKLTQDPKSRIQAIAARQLGYYVIRRGDDGEEVTEEAEVRRPDDSNEPDEAAPSYGLFGLSTSFRVDTAVVTALLAIASHPSHLVRRAVAGSLASAAEKSEPVCLQFQQYLQDSDPEIRATVAACSIFVKRLELVNDPEVVVRFNLAFSLGLHGFCRVPLSPEETQVALQLSRDADPEVVQRAISSLASPNPSTEALDRLFELLDGSDLTLRFAAQGALWSLGEHDRRTAAKLVEQF